MRHALKGVVTWLVLTVPLGIVVGRALRAAKDGQTRPVSREPWAPREPQPRAVPDRPVPRAHRAR